jgi:alpha-ribazole phosphatase
MTVTRIVLCRHGEPEAAAFGRFWGALDIGLSEAGRVEAEQLAASLPAAAPAAVYTSPARRTLDTAAPIAAALALEPVIDERLREIDFGEIGGLSYDEVAAGRPELYAEWLQAPTLVRFPGGECYADLRRRVVAALADVTARHAEGAAVVVSHAGVIRSLLAEWLLLPDEAVFRIDQRFGAVNVVDVVDGIPIVRLLNGPPASPLLGA